MESNEVMDLCMQGIADEGTGDAEQAKRFFQKAWDGRQDDFDSCVAHYEELARAEADYADVKRSREFFALASERAERLPPGGYADMVSRGATAGLRRADAILGAAGDAG